LWGGILASILGLWQALKAQPAMALGGAIMEVLRIEGLTKIFGSGRLEVRAIEDINLSISQGDLVALLGPSGSGKTTLLLCISLILEPTKGKIVFDGQTIYQKNGWAGVEVRRLRREKIGFIFQAHNLIPFLTARQNVLFPLSLVGLKGEKAESRVKELLEYMEIADRADYLPAILSGGEQQRVAIARALANKAKLILADEPTASLDSTRGMRVMELLKKIAKENQSAVIVVTHDVRMIEGFDYVYHLKDGHINHNQ
jgi:putative ABC transport system ATP-binding protein